MKDIYIWLFEHYAQPKLKPLETDQQKAAAAFARRLSLDQKTRLRLVDFTDNLRLDWGIETFALGLRCGMRLSGPRPRSWEPGRLLDFLP